MQADHWSLWVDNDTRRMYMKEANEWRRIPRIYHPAHNVYCTGQIEPGVVLSTERDWWYDNDTGIWWCAVGSGWQMARKSCVPSGSLPDPTWTSHDNVTYTAVLYNTIEHYRQHREDEAIPDCIQLERLCEPAPSYEHPTSLLAQNGAWVPNRPVYFGVPSYERHSAPPAERRCTKCWWYLSTVSVGDLEETYRLETSHPDKTRRVAFGPLHLDTIFGLHCGYPLDEVWIAPSDGVTPPPYSHFQYTLLESNKFDESWF